MIKYGIKCRRVIDSMMFNPNWYVPDDDNPYCEDWDKNPLYETEAEAIKVRDEYLLKDATKNYIIYKKEIL